MPNLFQNFLNQVNRGYGQLDKNVFKGVLPGGAASPLSNPKATIQKIVSPQNARDSVAVPLLDAAMQAGVVPAAPAMYARFLSGTEKPLTKLHPDVLKEIPAAFKNAERFATDYVNQLHIPRDLDNSFVVDKQGRIGVKYNSYMDKDSSALENTLGQFYVDKNTKEITDRYDFNYYMPDWVDRRMTSIEGGLDMLIEGNPRALIPFAHNLGLIKPGSGYPIQVKP